MRTGWFSQRPPDEVPVAPMLPQEQVPYLLGLARLALEEKCPYRAAFNLAQAVEVAARGEGFDEVALRRQAKEIREACGPRGLA